MPVTENSSQAADVEPLASNLCIELFNISAKPREIPLAGTTLIYTLQELEIYYRTDP